MKMRLLLAPVGLAITFAMPALSQQTNTPDPQLRQQIVALAKKFDDAYNNNDAAALAALYTEDAIEVTDQGPISGREAIEKHFADVFKKVHFSNHLLTIDQDSPHSLGTGNELWETGQWSCTITVQGRGGIQLKGYHSSIAVLEGDAWKKRLITWNVTPAPTPPAQTQTK
jgi:ketosteroid isomerase-like protein